MTRFSFAAALVATLLVAAAAQAAPPRARHPVAEPAQPLQLAPQLQVGSLTLTHCHQRRAYCGSLPRPLDPAGEVPGTIDIGIEFYPRSDRSQPALGTIVATEGGPGSATTSSRASYLGLFTPLLDRRNLLLVDNRGTGTSAPLDCPELQLVYPLTQEAVLACGQQLAERSDLYGTGLAADDLAAVIDAMELGAVDLYGDSYGTFFGQAFAARHPQLLRSLTLDGTFQVTGLSPWYQGNARTVRRAFDAVCRRAAACRDLDGRSLDRIAAMVEALRTAPVSGVAPDGNGTPRSVTADPVAVAFLMTYAGYTRVIYRELDAAARAWQAGDVAPLLRMLAETLTDASATDGNVRQFSSALFVAVSCSDYPQLYDMTAPPAARLRQRDRAVARKAAANPALYAPFAIEEFAAMPLDYSLLDLCLNWPVPSRAHPPGQPVPPGASFTAAPVLVLSGELDTVTSPPQGRAAAAQFANAQQIIVANSFHVTALGDLDHCASKLVRRFVATLSPGDTSCADAIPEVRLVPAFASGFEGLSPATPAAGNQAGERELRAATAAVLAAGDAVGRWWVNYDHSSVGLRGGAFTWSGTPKGCTFALDDLRFVADLGVSGDIDWNYGTGEIVAHLSLAGPGVPAGTLTVTWNDLQPGAIATIDGTLDGRVVAASMPAP